MPNQVGKLTPREFSNLLDGYNKRREHKQEDMARQAIMIGRVRTEKRITFDKLLGRSAEKKTNVISLDERRKIDDHIDKAFGL